MKPNAIKCSSHRTIQHCRTGPYQSRWLKLLDDRQFGFDQSSVLIRSTQDSSRYQCTQTHKWNQLHHSHTVCAIRKEILNISVILLMLSSYCPGSKSRITLNITQEVRIANALLNCTGFLNKGQMLPELTSEHLRWTVTIHRLSLLLKELNKHSPPTPLVMINKAVSVSSHYMPIIVWDYQSQSAERKAPEG